MTNKEAKAKKSIAKDMKSRKAQLKELSLKLLKGVKGGAWNMLEGGTARNSYHY